MRDISEQELDNYISEGLKYSAAGVQPSAGCKTRIDSMISDARQHSAHRGSILKNNKFARAAAKAGISVSAPRSFSNGYSFSSCSVTSLADVDDNGIRMNPSKGIELSYAREGYPKITLTARNAEADQSADTVSETRKIGNISVSLSNTTGLFVPAGYKVSEAELQRAKNDPSFFISYGSSKKKSFSFTDLIFTKDGLIYDMNVVDNRSLSSDDLFAMAEEIINSK